MDDSGADEAHGQQLLSELAEQAVDWLDQLGSVDKVFHLVADDSLNHHEATFWL